MKTDNELIAEFMGYINTTPTDKDFNIYEHPKTKKLIETMSMQYHISWEWLMPVYNKLTKDLDIAWKITSKGVNIHNHGNDFDGTWDINCPENVIIDAHRAVVEFIKWYNENLKQ